MFPFLIGVSTGLGIAAVIMLIRIVQFSRRL